METAPEYRFGLFRFDARSGELRRASGTGGQRRRLRPKTALVLATLLERAGTLVERDELVTAVWGDTVVEFDQAINACIREIRAALGDDATRPVYIETLARRGYRFLAPVTRDAEPGATATPARGVAPNRPRERADRRAPFGLRPVSVAALVVATIVLGTFAVWTGSHDRRAQVAVLPLRGDATAPGYEAEAATEDLISELARLDPDELGVIARTSSAAAAAQGGSARDIAARLGTQYVVEGRADATPLGWRLDLRVIRADGQSQIWAGRFDGGAEVVAQAAREIAEAVGAPATVVPSPATGTADAAARDFRLRARWLLQRHTMEDTRLALPLYDSALARDPGFAAAQAERGEVLLRLGRTEEGRAELAAALAIDPTLSGAEQALGVSRFYVDGDVAVARAHFERGLAHAPGSASLHLNHAYLLAAAGQPDRAVAAARRALRLDPAVAQVRGDVGWVFYYAGRPADALEECGRQLEMRPGSASGLRCRLFAAVAAGAGTQARTAAAALGRTVEMPADLRSTLDDGSATSLAAFWRWLADRCDRCAARDRVRALVRLGAHERALDDLHDATSASVSAGLFLAADPILAPLRSSGRFQAMVERSRGPVAAR